MTFKHLHKMNQCKVALVLAQEAVNVHCSLPAERPSSFMITSSIRDPDALCDLTCALWVVENFSDADTVCQGAVKQYRDRVSATGGGTNSLNSLATGANLLCRCLMKVERHDDVLNAGYKAVSIYCKLFNADSLDNIKHYLSSLLALLLASIRSSNTGNPQAMAMITEVARDACIMLMFSQSDLARGILCLALQSHGLILEECSNYHELCDSGE